MPSLGEDESEWDWRRRRIDLFHGKRALGERLPIFGGNPPDPFSGDFPSSLFPSGWNSMKRWLNDEEEEDKGERDSATPTPFFTHANDPRKAPISLYAVRARTPYPPKRSPAR